MYKRQLDDLGERRLSGADVLSRHAGFVAGGSDAVPRARACLLYTSDAADERSSVDLGGRRIIKKKTNITQMRHAKHIR